MWIGRGNERKRASAKMYTSPSVNWYSDEERDMAGKEVFDTLLERLEKWCKEHPEKKTCIRSWTIRGRKQLSYRTRTSII